VGGARWRICDRRPDCAPARRLTGTGADHAPALAGSTRATVQSTPRAEHAIDHRSARSRTRSFPWPRRSACIPGPLVPGRRSPNIALPSGQMPIIVYIGCGERQ
jgi:hypothetical protein